MTHIWGLMWCFSGFLFGLFLSDDLNLIAWPIKLIAGILISSFVEFVITPTITKLFTKK